MCNVRPLMAPSPRTALITGGSKRIGREIALALAARKIQTIIHYRKSSTDAEALCAEIERMGVRSWMLRADFAVESETRSLIEKAWDTAAPIDILVNNAAQFPSDRFEDLTFENLAKNIQINAWAPFCLAREFAKHASSGQIINLIDSRVTSFDWTHVGYILSKHVLAEMNRMMVVQFAPAIRVNAIAPGLILPPPGYEHGYLDERVRTVPLERHGNPEDIARAVIFLIESPFVSGETVYVDGGRHIIEYPREGARRNG